MHLGLSRFQVHVRSLLRAGEERRRRDIDHCWPATLPHRTTLRTFVYGATLVYIAVCVYTLLIYGA